MDRDSLYFLMQLMQTDVRMYGMKAIPRTTYMDKDFVNLIDEYSIHHSRFPFYRG